MRQRRQESEREGERRRGWRAKEREMAMDGNFLQISRSLQIIALD
jgi:hypothetical protein